MERRKFTREFKLEAVKLIQERGVTVAQAGRDLGVHGTVLRRWVQECGADSQQAFPGDLAPLNGSRSYGRVGPKGGLHAAAASHRRTDSRQIA